jgi:hypothetical protein
MKREEERKEGREGGRKGGTKEGKEKEKSNTLFLMQGKYTCIHALWNKQEFNRINWQMLQSCK